MAGILLFDTSVYIAYIRKGERADLVERATEGGRVVLSSVVAMELYAGARTAREKSILDQFVASMQRMSAYEVPRHDDWARGGILIERFTRVRGHARMRDHFRDILVALAAVNRGAVLVTGDAHIASWEKMLKRQGETLRLKIL